MNIINGEIKKAEDLTQEEKNNGNWIDIPESFMSDKKQDDSTTKKPFIFRKRSIGKELQKSRKKAKDKMKNRAKGKVSKKARKRNR